jgi:hypothetical protein
MALTDRIDYPKVLLGALATVLVIALVVAASTSTAAFGVYNPAWDGAGELRSVAASQGAEATVAINTSAYETVTPNETVALVLSPELAYGNDSARLRRFVRQGGTLVVGEDFGPQGNAVLEAVGATARFDGRLVRDERRLDRGPSLPHATNVSEPNATTGNLTAGVNRLTLNYATVIEPGNATVLVGTSEFSYLDGDRDGEVGDEPLRSYPVVTVESVGEGRVIAVSDPSLFINAMLDRGGNRQFTANLFSTERVLLDYSRAGGQPPLTVALLTVRGSPLLQGGLLALAVGVVVWGTNVVTHGRATDESTREVHRERLVRYLVRERGWDAERAERLTTGVWGRGAEGEANE